MHEDELSFASNLLSDTNITNSFIMGKASQSDIKKMRQKGLVVQELEKKETEFGLQKVKWKHKSYQNREISDNLSIGAEELGSVIMGVGDPISHSGDTIALATIDLTGENYFLITLVGPLIDQWKKTLNNIDVELLECTNNFEYRAKLSFDNLQDLKDLDFVNNVSLIDQGITNIITESALSTSGDNRTGKKILKFDLILHEPSNTDKVLDWLKDNSIRVEGYSRNKIRVYLLQDSPYITSIVGLKEVSRIEEYIEPKLFNDKARLLLNLDKNQSSTVNLLGYQGDGEIIGIADTGIDDSHNDFKNRISRIFSLGRMNDYSDHHGHGTHVAGSVLGDGAESGGKYKGTAPKAKLIFQSLMDSRGGLGGLPIHLGDLFDEAYQLGARIHNNSWGAATNSRYTINSTEVDEYVDQNRDMLVLFAAGNEGAAKNNLNAAVGFVDWLSIGSPASSKNALTVGASRSNRTSGGISRLTYGQAWPNDFPDPPIADEKISGKATSIAGYSSRGPCDDGRIKPDIVAPGTDIVSTKSSIASIGNFDGSVRGTRKYAFMGGTSMACPLVSGCAAVVREYYRKEKNNDTPSASLVKATLINGTKELQSQDAMSPYNIIPNFHQGFGRVDMVNTIPNSGNNNLKLAYIDNWKNPLSHFNNTGDRKRYTISVGDKLPFRVCLSYIDLPGRALQNNLNLIVEYNNNGNRIKQIGNEAFTKTPGNYSIPDTKNNIEIVRIKNPKPGNFLIQVFAFNLLRGGQDFSLVVTGDLRSDLIEI